MTWTEAEYNNDNIKKNNMIRIKQKKKKKENIIIKTRRQRRRTARRRSWSKLKWTLTWLGVLQLLAVFSFDGG